MADERAEYEVLTPIDDPAHHRPAYLPGQPIHAQVVEDWGLRIGTADDPEAQVLSLRPQEMARPASNASQQEWLRYRAGKPGANVAELELLGRNQLRDMDARDMDAPPTDTADERDTDEPTDPAGEEQAKE